MFKRPGRFEWFDNQANGTSLRDLEIHNIHPLSAAMILRLLQFIDNQQPTLDHLAISDCSVDICSIPYLLDSGLLKRVALQGLIAERNHHPHMWKLHFEKAIQDIQNSKKRPRKHLSHVDISRTVLCRDEDMKSILRQVVGNNPDLSRLTLDAEPANQAQGPGIRLWSIQTLGNQLLRVSELEIWGERSIEWMEELGRLVTHPKCSLKRLSLHLGSHARAETLAPFVDGIGRNRTLGSLSIVHEGRNYGFETEMLAEIEILLEAFSNKTASNNDVSLKSFQYEGGVDERDSSVEAVLQRLFDNGLRLEEIKLGHGSHHYMPSYRSFKIQYLALRSRIWNATVAGKSLYSIVQMLIHWKEHGGGQNLDRSMRQQLFFSGLWLSIRDNSRQLVQLAGNERSGIKQ